MDDLKRQWETYKQECRTFWQASILPELKTKRMGIMLLSVGLLFGLIFGYQWIKGMLITKYIKASAAPVIAVSTIQAGYLPWQPNLKASASLRAVRGVDVTTELAGLVRSIEFTPGATVQSGDILVQLNADVEFAQLQSLEAAAELARITYERDRKQVAIHAISQAILDADAADLKSKTAQAIQQAATVAKKTIRAPFAGRLGISAINLGQYINTGEKVVTLQSLDPIYVDFFMPQQSLSQLSVGQVVTLKTDAYPKDTFIGKITTINPKVDPATRNVEVEATISNPDYKLLPGMYGQTEIAVGVPEKYLTLPQSAISFNPYGELVYLVKENGRNKKGEPILIAEQSFVTVGDARGDQIVILKGVKAGDKVVTSGQLKLKNGSSVVINNTVVPTNLVAPDVVNE